MLFLIVAMLVAMVAALYVCKRQKRSFGTGVIVFIGLMVAEFILSAVIYVVGVFGHTKDGAHTSLLAVTLLVIVIITARLSIDRTARTRSSEYGAVTITDINNRR